MGSYRLVVCDGKGVVFSQGTGWFASEDLVATAFHVVGNDTARDWYDRAPGKEGSTYSLVGPAGQIALEPCCFDASADIALLRCYDPDPDMEPLRLADGVGMDQEWFTDGFPGFDQGKGWTLNGKVARVRGDHLQLSVEQGTDVPWEGISGGAVCVGLRAVGLITSVTTGTRTAWGANYKAVDRLLKVLRLAEKAGKLLENKFFWKSDLVELRHELGYYVDQDQSIEAILIQLNELEKPEVSWPLSIKEREGLEHFSLGLVKDGLKRITPAPLNPDPWWNQYSPLFDNLYRAERFGGRTEELYMLDQFLDYSEGGYFFVTGAMGFGKTALLATWVRLLKRRGERLAFHFITKEPLKYATNGLDECLCLSSLCGQIAAAYGLGGELPKDKDQLHRLYFRLLSLSPPTGERVIVVLDGLDEAVPRWVPGTGMFPTPLQPGVYVVFSGRKKADKQWLTDLGLSLPANHVCTLGCLGPEAIKEAVCRSQILTQRTDSFDKTLDRVITITQGNPSYLAYVLKTLARNSGNPECLDEMPKSLSEALDNWWTEVFEKQGAGEAFEDLMGLLALLREPFRRDALADISLEDKLRHANINGLIEKCLDVLSGGKERGYRLADNSVLDLVHDKLSDRMDVFRNWVAEFCMRWSNPKFRRRSQAYALHYGVDHLLEFNRLEDALRLITPEWLSARWKAEGSYSGVIDDLDRLVRHLIDHKLIARKEPIELCGPEFSLHIPALAVARETARELMTKLPNSILRAMVRLGDGSQVLKLLDALSGWRGEAVQHLISVAAEILDLPAEIKEERRKALGDQVEQAVRLLHGKVDIKVVSKIEKLFKEAIAGSGSSAKELHRIAQTLGNTIDPGTLTALASEFLSTIESSKENSFKVAFELLTRALGILDLVRSTMMQWEKFDSIVRIILQHTSMSRVLLDKLVQQSIAFAESRREPELRAASLGRMAELALKVGMTEDGRRLLQRAQQSLENISEPGARLVPWAACIPALRALNAGGVQGVVCGLFTKVETTIGDSRLVVNPLDVFVERWDPASHNERIWAFPLLLRIGEAQLGINHRLSGIVLGALCKLGQLDTALDLLHRKWKAQPESAARSLFSFLDVLANKNHALAIASLADAKKLLRDLREENPDFFRAELAEAMAVVGAWEELGPLLASMSPGSRKNAVIACLNVLRKAEPDANTIRETVDDLMKAAAYLRPDEQAEVEGEAAWVIAPFDRDYARSYLTRCLHRSLSELPNGSLDYLRKLFAIALAEHGRFSDAIDVVNDCELPTFQIEALTDTMKAAPTVDHEGLHKFADEVVGTVNQVDISALASVLLAACKTVLLLARELPDEAGRIMEQVERRLEEIKEPFDLATVCVAQISAFAATDSIQAVEKLRSLLKWMGNVGIENIDASAWPKICRLFCLKAVKSQSSEFLGQAEALLKTLTKSSDRVIYGAPYAAALIEFDRNKALDLLEQYVDILTDLVPEYPRWQGFFVMMAEIFNTPLAVIAPWETTLEALASVAHCAPETFERLSSKTISSLFAKGLSDLDLAKAIKSLLSVASKVPLSVQEQLARTIHCTLGELSGLLQARDLDFIIDNIVVSLACDGHKKAASTMAKYATGSKTKEHVQWTLKFCESRDELIDKTALEEVYLQHKDEHTAVMAFNNLITVRKGSKDLAAYFIFKILDYREVQRPRFVLLENFIPLLTIPCLKLWGLNAVETIVNNINGLDEYFMKAAELISSDP